MLFSVAGGYDMSMSEIQEAAEVITGAVSPDANIIFGASIRPELQDEIVITVVATGFDSDYYKELAAQEEAEKVAKEEAERKAKEEAEAEAKRKELEAQQTTDSADFTSNNKANMWDSIDKTEPEEDLDVPPSLRNRIKK